jgi:alkylhydroperoxidase family enzyme
VAPRPRRPCSTADCATASQIADARAAGATDLEIHDTVLIAAAFCMMNRYVDGLAAITAGAQRLIKDGYVPPSA